MFNHKLVLTACGVAILMLVAAASGNAWGTFNRTTHLTFNRPVALPGVTLGAGTYIFELADPGMNLDIVRVLSNDRRRVYLMAFTAPIERPKGRPDLLVSLGEAPPGAAPPITAWYEMGENRGHRFIY